MALICGFAAIFGAAAPAGAATESFTLTSASLPGQSSVTWQGPPVNPPGTPNVFPSTVSLSGQIDSSTGDISGATLSLPPLPQPEQQGENTTFTFSEVNPGSATGNFNSSTGAVTLNDSLTLTFTGTGAASITCVSTPINVAFSGTWDSSTQDVTLAASGFTIPQFPASSGENCDLAATDLNASPGGTAGAVGNAFSLALNGQFAPGLPTTTTLTTSVPSPQLADTSVTLTATVVDPSAAGTPTGSVTFDANGQSIGTGTLSASGTTGTATAALTTTSLPQAANQLTAVYAGDATYSGSTSAAVPYTIQALPTISSTFPSQLVGGNGTFPTPTPFTLTISNPVGGATYTNNLFLYLGLSPKQFSPSNIQLSYEDPDGNWCPLTLSTTAKPPTGSPLPTGIAAVFFGGQGTPPCGFSSAFSLNPGASVTFNLEIALNQSESGRLLTGGISFVTALETGSCTSSSACTAVAPLSGESAVTSQAQSNVPPQAGPGTVAAAITDTSWPGVGGSIRSGYAMFLSAEVGEASDAVVYTTTTPTGTLQWFVDGQLVTTATLKSSTAVGGTSNVLVTGGTYQPPVPLSPGTHTLTFNYSGDQNYAPSSLSETFTVIAGPPTGTLYVCAATGFTGSPTGNFNAYLTATGSLSTTAAFSGTSVTASNVSVTLDLDPATINGANVDELESVTDGAMVFSPSGTSQEIVPEVVEVRRWSPA